MDGWMLIKCYYLLPDKIQNRRFSTSHASDSVISKTIGRWARPLMAALRNMQIGRHCAQCPASCAKHSAKVPLQLQWLTTSDN